MNHKYVIGEYVVPTNLDEDIRENWQVRSQVEEGGVTKYVVYTSLFGKKLTVAEEDLRPLHNEHAHVETESRDCDGLYTGSRVARPNDEERRDLFGDLYFRQRILADVVSLHGEGTLKVRPTGLDWYEHTDEGYHSAEVHWCVNDTCSGTRPSHRDHTAEAAGY